MLDLKQYEVDELISTRKFVARVLHGSIKRKEKTLSLDIRRVDSPFADITLRLNGRLEATRWSTPGFVLEWHGEQIRGLNHALSHPTFLNGVRQDKRVKGWHEHLWNEVDKDRYVIAAKPKIKHENFLSTLDWCLRQWGIESRDLDAQLGVRV